RADLHELEARLVGKQTRHRGLAGAGRPPEDQRAQRLAVKHPGQRAVRPEQLVLADDVGQLLRSELIGERPWRVVVQPRRGEQAWSCAAFGAGAHPPNTAEICWPPRWMVMRQTRA